MGQRHQIIVSYPEMYLNDKNPNNKPPRVDVIHHQWLYGYSAVAALNRALTLIANSRKPGSEGRDYLFGRDADGYTMGNDGTRAIGAAISVDPESGYYAQVHYWGESEGRRNNGKFRQSHELEPEMFDNNDGVTIIHFERGNPRPKYCFATPEHLEGKNWTPDKGQGPWSEEQYLEFYYDLGEFTAEELSKTAAMMVSITEKADLMTEEEFVRLFPRLRAGRESQEARA